MDNFYENNGYNSYQQQNQQYQPSQPENEKVMTVGSWLVTQLLLCIPIVNIILINYRKKNIKIKELDYPVLFYCFYFSINSFLFFFI